MTTTFEFMVLSYCEERGIDRWTFDEMPEELQVGPLAVRMAKQHLASWQNYEARMRMER